MSVLNLRPHYLAVLVAGNGVIDENGDYQPDARGEAYKGRIPCNAVPAGKAATITLPDGVTREYSYTVYMDPGVPDIKAGDRVRIFNKSDNSLLAEKEVLGFFPYQLGGRLWV